VVVTRRDLPISYQAVQAAHAAIDFQHAYTHEAKEWHKSSNYLIFLTVENEDELKKLILKSAERYIKLTPFREPDIDNELTAVALEPSEATRKVTSSLPLMKNKETCS
jgi:peptidyl-tRNA hydrolase